MNTVRNQLSLYDPKEDLPLYGRPAGPARYTNADVQPTALFGSEYKRVTFQTEPDFGRMVEAAFPADGDYFRTLLLEIGLPAIPLAPGSTYTGWTNAIAFALIRRIRLFFNGQLVNDWDGQLLRHLYEQLPTDPQRDAFLGIYLEPNGCWVSANTARTLVIDIPWLCGQTLPRRVMPLTAITMTIELNDFQSCVTFDGPTPPPSLSVLQDSVKLHLERLYLPPIAAALIPPSGTLLFDQYQTVTWTTEMGNEATVPLEFTHPVKSLIFTLQDQESIDNNDYCYINYDTGLDLLVRAKLSVVGKEIFGYKTAFELNRVTTWGKYGMLPRPGVYTMPFCDKPTVLHPTGSINLSKGCTQELHLQLVDGTRPLVVKVYAQAINWIDISDGDCRVRWL